MPTYTETLNCKQVTKFQQNRSTSATLTRVTVFSWTQCIYEYESIWM